MLGGASTRYLKASPVAEYQVRSAKAPFTAGDERWREEQHMRRHIRCILLPDNKWQLPNDQHAAMPNADMPPEIESWLPFSAAV